MHVMRKYNAKPQRICIFFRSVMLFPKKLGEKLAAMIMVTVRTIFFIALCKYYKITIPHSDCDLICPYNF